MAGKVYLIGAGPGDPRLITLKGLECIRRADVVVYDRLVSERLLEHARPGAELIYVGKAPGAHSVSQAYINDVLVKKASSGLTVARLKGGDPTIFGRGGDEALALANRGIPFEFVPGVSSAYAVPAYAGIPVTKRGMTSTVTVVTGHKGGEGDGPIDWKALVDLGGTLVFLMGFRSIEEICSNLLENGMPPGTPAAVVSHGTTEEQRSVFGTIDGIGPTVRRSGMSSPVVIIVGRVVGLHDKLSWFKRTD